MNKPSTLKNTLNLPRTDFPMKAQLPQREPQLLAEWNERHLYERILEVRAGAPLFTLHDGPPYTTGDLHLGTGLNKIVKDMVVKSKSMAGFRAPYIPGWDCHGLPIESKVEKELGGKKDSVSPAEFRRRCREYANRYMDQHRRDFRRMGIFGRWEKPYLTMDFSYEATTADAFLMFLEKGYIYRGLKPVYWCFHDRTALAEAEVEYEDHSSPSIWVTFAVVGDRKKGLPGNDVSALIWTTTPWTLPANRALAFHPDFEYVVVETPRGKLLLAEERVSAVASELGLEMKVTGHKWKGRDLEGMLFQHPFLDQQVPAILGGHVTLDQGSGIVHTAPGHGSDDFYVGQKYGLQPYAPLDDEARFTEGLPEYLGKTVFEANPAIIALLRSRGALLGEAKIQHSYPHCWRCHNPVIFRATEQWFVGLEHAGLRERALEELPKVKWTPEWGQERLHEMIATRPDWCISRQRFWGVPLVIFYCDACGERLDDFAALRNVIRWFEKEGADAWYQHSAEELLPAETKCKCGEAKWRKESDILDVWFDSGSSNLAVLSEEDGTWPADVYLEGPDQYRGWFHSSLLVAVGVKGRAPYRQVVTHGWTLDADGRPMSKSLGNALAPSDVYEKWGADLLRLWVAWQDYQTDQRMSDAVMNQVAEAYRKIRNTLRFALSNLYDFDPARDMVPDSQLMELDAWALERTGELVQQCRDWYEQFEFHRVMHAIHDFCAVDLSSFYFDVLKDRLYTFAPRSAGRRSAQTAIYRIAHALVRLATPILVFTAEEAWKYFPRAAGDLESVHLTVFPSAKEFQGSLNENQLAAWERLLGVRGQVLQALEKARNDKLVAGSLEAKVVLEASGALRELLEKRRADLPALFIVSQVEIQPAGTTDGNNGGELLSVRVVSADGAKCERCWNFSTAVGTFAEYPTLCDRCAPVVTELAREAASGERQAAS